MPFRRELPDDIAPPGLASVDDFRELLTVALRDLEEQTAREFEGRLLCMAAVLPQKPPASREPKALRKALRRVFAVDVLARSR